MRCDTSGAIGACASAINAYHLRGRLLAVKSLWAENLISVLLVLCIGDRLMFSITPVLFGIAGMWLCAAIVLTSYSGARSSL
jgi:hypothetical protein